MSSLTYLTVLLIILLLGLFYSVVMFVGLWYIGYDTLLLCLLFDSIVTNKHPKNFIQIPNTQARR